LPRNPFGQRLMLGSLGTTAVKRVGDVTCTHAQNDITKYFVVTD